MEQRDAPPQKREPAIHRSSSIDTSTPRLQPDHRRPQSFSSPAYSPVVSPSFSDHSTSRGFYSPRSGAEDEDEVDDDDVELHDVVDERGYLYRPRSPVTDELPVISTVSRSVRVEPKVVTRVDGREFVERRVVEDGGLDFGGGAGGRGGSVRRKWEGRNTVVFDSGLKEKEVFMERRVVEEESSVDFRGRKVFDFGAREEEAVVVARGRRVVGEDSLEFGDRKGRKSNEFVSDSGVREKEVVPQRRVVKEESVELGDRKGPKSNAFVSDSIVKEKEVVPHRRVVEVESVELGDQRGRKLNTFVSDSGVKEKEAMRGVRVLQEGSIEFRDGRGIGVKLDARNAMVVDSSPKLVYNSRPKEEVAGTKTVVYESGRKEGEESDGARVVEGGGGGGGEGVEGVKPSMRRRQEGRRSEVLVLRKAALCLRVLALVMCVISFSIMAVNKNKGWALDSFDRYKEFRYCMAVSILGFVYSAAQAGILAYHLGTDKYSNQHSLLRYYLDFFMDQALSYLLISASSSAATRVEDWVSNWGKDKFPQMASASVIVSFLAFGAFAFSSLVSGYTLCSANVS